VVDLAVPVADDLQFCRRVHPRGLSSGRYNDEYRSIPKPQGGRGPPLDQMFSFRFRASSSAEAYDTRSNRGLLTGIFLVMPCEPQTDHFQARVPAVDEQLRDPAAVPVNFTAFDQYRSPKYQL
jgi:hypothetical protein